MSTLAISMNMSCFKALCQVFSAQRPIMVRGRPGIGKSQSVHQVGAELRDDVYRDAANCAEMTAAFSGEAQVKRTIKRFWQRNGSKPEYASYNKTIWHYDMGIPVVERRLSQLQEGDVVGLPFEGKLGTIFKPTEWLLLTAYWPCILFLDELNRASKAVEQATFQIADSKAFYGHTLHENTRVYVACNIGDAFDVTPMDPAAISRYAVIDLEPSLEDWLAWAAVNCAPELSDFIRTNPSMLEWGQNQEFEPNRKVHDRRAWGNLDAELQQSGLYKNPTDMRFLHMAASMVGFSAGNSFWNFVKDHALDISAEDILKGWDKVKGKLPPAETDKFFSKVTELAGKVNDYLLKTDLTKTQLKELGKFMRDLPAEHLTTTWQASGKRRANFIGIHPHISDILIRVGSGLSVKAAAANEETTK